MSRPQIAAALLFAAYIGTQGVPAWNKVQKSSDGRDYATYHYAVKVAAQGGDPYDKRELGRLAQQEGTRKSVHPYFYPPPFLLGMLWALPLSLKAGYLASFWLNQLALAGTLWVLRRWIGVSWLALAAITFTLSPLGDSAKMGQANMPVLLLTCLALWRGRGLLLAPAGMAKMAPAIFVAWWAARLRWRPVLGAALGAVALSLVALPLVGPAQQLRFFTEVLPGFASGSYHGLTVPISLPANHSIPDLLNQWRPGPDKLSMDPLARRIASLINLALVAGACLAARRTRDTIGEAALAGVFTILMLVIPVYAYEHHLVATLLPAAALAAAASAGRLSRPALVLAGIAYAAVAWPLAWLREAQDLVPAPLGWLLQESKTMGLLGLALACLSVALRSPEISPQPKK